MKRTFIYIRNALNNSYPSSEIESFISIIFENIFNYSKHDIILNDNKVLSKLEFEKVEEVVHRLQNFEPIQYIFGQTWFYNLPFEVNRNVLIPRHETEELVDLILKNHKNEPLKILDIGTGSGCIPIALKKCNPLFKISSCDISEEALKTAKRNAIKNEVEINFMHKNILSNKTFGNIRFDLIVSNPPYIAENEKTMMNANVLEYEPHLALFVPDNDPLLFYRQIISHSKQILRQGGEIYFEINEAYGIEINNLLKKNNFESKLYKDINGKDRIAFGLKSN